MQSRHEKHSSWKLVGAAFAVVLGITTASEAQLSSYVEASGPIALSVDAGGNNDATGYDLQVDKPAGGTVDAAYLFAATYDFSAGLTIPDGDLTLNGSGVAWDDTVSNSATGIVWINHAADVTGLVAATLDAAPAGTVNIPVLEGSLNGNIDGTILAVIFNDPAASNNGVVLLFGGQQTTGDQFTISLAEPLDLMGDAKADMGLGISFSFQGSAMISQIDVNGARMTSSAGGQDDGGGFNGGLITAGGVGDSNANPPDPFAPPTDTFYDDELYDLVPFVNDGDTAIVVDTFNPTDDDNIFFGFFCTSVPIIVDEGILLGPLSSTCPTGSEHCVTALVLDGAGDPISGRDVDFEVISGPNAGDSGTVTTDADGEAEFCYLGDGGDGVDIIEACMMDDAGAEICSNTVEKIWVSECFMVLGDGPGDDQYLPAGFDFMFDTQVSNINEAYPVLMNSYPSFVIPLSTVAVAGVQGGNATQTVVAGMPGFVGRDGKFAVQVMMWNPEDVPQNPEQYSAGLMVSVDQNGSITSRKFGDGEIDIWMEKEFNEDGDLVISFPFQIAGF